MGELFDRYVAVDWSAAGRPTTGRDSIWIAVLDTGRHPVPRLVNPRTRQLAERELGELRTAAGRTLVAVDASLGYPTGTADWFGLDGDDRWRAMWEHLAAHVTDDERNRNNRFEVAAALNRRRRPPGPFWGRPAAASIEGLDPRKPSAFPVPEFRRVEGHLRGDGLRPASCWQLLGAGSVGSQTLTVLPVVHRLLGRGSVEVWPFTTGLTAPTVPPGRLVVAETWPTAFGFDVHDHAVRDAAQVGAVVRHLRDADAAGDLARWFAPDLPAAERAAVEVEEGWVLRPPGRSGS